MWDIHQDAGADNALLLMRLKSIVPARLYGIARHLHDTIGMPQRDHRPDLRVSVFGVAHTQRTGCLYQKAEKLLIHIGFNDHSLRGNTLLPARAEAGRRDTLRGIGEIGILQYNICGVRPELGDKLACSRNADQSLTGRGAAGESYYRRFRGARQGYRRRADRKSTRLNSSH